MFSHHHFELIIKHSSETSKSVEPAQNELQAYS